MPACQCLMVISLGLKNLAKDTVIVGFEVGGSNASISFVFLSIGRYLLDIALIFLFIFVLIFKFFYKY